MARLLIAALMIQGATCFGQTAPPKQTIPAAQANAPAQATSPIERVRELIEAAQHLEAGGAHDLARQARSQAEALLAEQSERLAHQQRQLEELSARLHARQIIVAATILEARNLSPAKLAKMIEEAEGELVNPGGATSALFDRNDAAAHFVKALAYYTVDYDALSRPSVITLDGRAAEVQIGQVVPVIDGVTIGEGGAVPMTADAFTGISMGITPRFLGDEGIRLEVAVEQSQIQANGVPIFTDPVTGDSISSPIRDMKTAQVSWTVPHGQGWLLAIERIAVEDAEDVGEESDYLLVFLQPRVAD